VDTVGSGLDRTNHQHKLIKVSGRYGRYDDDDLICAWKL